MRSGGSCTRGRELDAAARAGALHAACAATRCWRWSSSGRRGRRRDGYPAAAARRVGELSADTRRRSGSSPRSAEPTLEAVETAWAPAGGLEEALAADVLVRDGRRVRFSHPLIAAVVQERTPPGEWRAVHARLAELTDGPEQRARHLAAASDGPDERRCGRARGGGRRGGDARSDDGGRRAGGARGAS